MGKHTLEELRQRQALPLEAKIEMSYARVKDWIDAFGEQGVCISFSGGKDSTVLLDLVRNRFGYSNVKAVFVDVPTQLPELRQFVKTFENVDIIKPKMNFMQVCEKYGFPLISKEVSETVSGARKYLRKLANDKIVAGGGDRKSKYSYKWGWNKLNGIGRYSKCSGEGEKNKRGEQHSSCETFGMVHERSESSDKGEYP